MHFAGLILLLTLVSCSTHNYQLRDPIELWKQQALTVGWINEESKSSIDWSVKALSVASPQKNIQLYNNLLSYVIRHCLNKRASFCKHVFFQCSIFCKGFSIHQRITESQWAIGVSGYHYRPRDNSREAFYPLEGIYQPVTFVSKPSSHGIVIIPLFLYEVEKDYLFLNLPLRRDFTLAYKALLASATIHEYERKGLFNADDERNFGIYRLQPLNFKKDIILMIHGLDSSPVIWSEISTAILSRPELVQRYQIWHVFYETGSPPLYNAHRLRSLLKLQLKLFSESGYNPKIMLIGHSMGGLISKMLASNSGEALWDATFTRSFSELFEELGAEIYNARSILYFQAVKGIDKIVFIDTPHRGANLSNSWMARVVSYFISLPKKVIASFNFSYKYNGLVTKSMEPFLQHGIPASIDVLQPEHPLTKIFSEISPVRGVKAWSIIGNKDISCYRLQKKCANDGVVSYSSAHQDYAKEIIVHSHHNSYKNIDSIRLILNILYDEN